MQKHTPENLETYLALAVHDLKTPVNAQILATQYLINSGEFKEETSEMLSDILASAKYLKDIVENILTKYSCDNDSMKINLSLNSIADVVNSAVNCTKYLLDEREIVLKIVSEVRNPIFKFDFLEIKRVINNLLSNAIEFSKFGGKIIVKIVEKSNNMEVSVQDFGCGINFKNPYDIFQKNLTFSKNQKRLGNGLGLYVSKQIIDAHFGKIGVQTELEKGTIISFQLPKNL